VGTLGFMAKGQTFKLRLDKKDRARLEAVADHIGVSIAATIRILVKERYDAIRLAKRAESS
jgi:antitoxin component of RelBE/YafQ-DinJ toxin-antitoxin module